MRAGRLRDRVDLYAPVAPSGGNPKPSFTLAEAGIAAGVEELKGREFWDAQTINSEAAIRVVMRWRSDISADWQIEFNGRRFDLVAPPQRDRRQDETLCYCKELR